MKIAVTLKIELLEGSEKGRIIDEGTRVFETQQDINDMGMLIERLKLNWVYIDPEQLWG